MTLHITSLTQLFSSLTISTVKMHSLNVSRICSIYPQTNVIEQVPDHYMKLGFYGLSKVGLHYQVKFGIHGQKQIGADVEMSTSYQMNQNLKKFTLELKYNGLVLI